MTEPPIATRPPNEDENLLRQKFYESFVAQSELMDQLARQLITLELAIPGLYATVFKLIQGSKGVGTVNAWLIGAFVCWFLSLTLTLFSLIPQKWKVNPDVLAKNPTRTGDELSLEEFFSQSAAYKRGLLIPACFLFLLAIAGAMLGSF